MSAQEESFPLQKFGFLGAVADCEAEFLAFVVKTGTPKSHHSK